MEAEIDELLREACDPKTVKDCEGRNLPVLCTKCEKNPKRKRKIGPYVERLYTVHLLQAAGFPFAADAFPYDFWLDLALLKQKIRARQACPMGGF